MSIKTFLRLTLVGFALSALTSCGSSGGGGSDIIRLVNPPNADVTVTQLATMTGAPDVQVYVSTGATQLTVECDYDALRDLTTP